MALATQRSTIEDSLVEFLRSMPRSYGRLFEHAEILQHLRVVNERGARLAHTGACQSTHADGIALCIVAESQPGLLSLVNDALLGQGLEVVTAHAFQRRVPESERSHAHSESIVLVWVHRSGPRAAQDIAQEDLRDLTYAFTQLMEQQQQRDASEQQRKSEVMLSPMQPRVYYDTQALRAGECVLVVQAPDCPGLLLAVTRALFRQGAEIVASEVRTANGVARDRFTLSAGVRNGFTPDRLADIQQDTLQAIRRLIAQQL